MSQYDFCFELLVNNEQVPQRTKTAFLYTEQLFYQGTDVVHLNEKFAKLPSSRERPEVMRGAVKQLEAVNQDNPNASSVEISRQFFYAGSPVAVSKLFHYACSQWQLLYYLYFYEVIFSSKMLLELKLEKSWKLFTARTCPALFLSTTCVPFLAFLAMIWTLIKM